jgi:hypothetical protein
MVVHIVWIFYVNRPFGAIDFHLRIADQSSTFAGVVTP